MERSNSTLRMHLRRLTRLVNAFSKSHDHLRDAVAIYGAWCNFCRVHQTLRGTPTEKVWEPKPTSGAFLQGEIEFARAFEHIPQTYQKGRFVESPPESYILRWLDAAQILSAYGWVPRVAGSVFAVSNLAP